MREPKRNSESLLSGDRSTLVPRRAFLALAGAGTAAVLGGRLAPGSDGAEIGRSRSAQAAGGPHLSSSRGGTVAGGVQSFRSRPDLRPPQVTIDVPVRTSLDGLVITECHAGLAQQGPLIIDQEGQVVWFAPLSPQPTIGARAFNVRVQSYQGKPALTWFEGSVVDGHGRGHYVICDQTYRHVRRIAAQRGLQGDLHAFLLTPRGTALFTCYARATGHVRVGRLVRSVPYWYGVVQEVDLASGRLLWSWRSDRHVGLSESYVPPNVRQGPAWDYFHINSISIDPADQNLVISGRNTWAAYKVDRRSGRVLWRLGGKHSDFRMGPGSGFAFQHDVEMRDDGVVTVFDNEGGPPQVAPQSRALVLLVDQQRRRVWLRRAIEHQPPVYSDALGNVQPLGDGRIFVGWGRSSFFTQYGPHGGVEFDGHLSAGISSYRAFLQPWSATPARPPDLTLTRSASSATLYASWNGATGVESWVVLGGPTATALQPLGTATVGGFETAITVPAAPVCLAVSAYSANGVQLGTSAVLS
ncbi:MAG: arylsulfotransferase family protein [Solirubrobacteraceae bacterium]